MPRISIIVPVYQMEECLNNCVTAILNQTFTDFELILVNDGSTDKSGELCDKFAEFDSRIKVIHQENQGQGFARNNGIKASSGEFIGFVDADDWIAPDMYGYLYRMCVDYQSDIAEVSAKVTNEKILVSNTKTVKFEVLEREDILETYLFRGLQDNTKYSVCNKLYSRELFQTTKFSKINYSEDFLINFKILSLVERMVMSSVIGYYYLQREGSTIHQELSKRNFNNLVNMNEVVEISKKTEKKELIALAEATHDRLYFSLLLKAMVYGQDDTISKEDILFLHKNLRSSYTKLLKSPMPLNRKAVMTLLVINKNVVHVLIKIMMTIFRKK